MATKRDDPQPKSMRISAPKDPEKATSAAFLRLLGATQQEAADAVGIGRIQISKWENSPWWSEYVDLARDRWLSGLAAKARNSVESAIPADARLAFQVLERLEPALSPKAALEVTGDSKRPISIEITRRIVE